MTFMEFPYPCKTELTTCELYRNVVDVQYENSH